MSADGKAPDDPADDRIAQLEARVAKLETLLVKVMPPRRRGKRCGWARAEDGFRFWLPWCWGGAVYGDFLHCTCDGNEDRKDTDETAVM